MGFILKGSYRWGFNTILIRSISDNMRTSENVLKPSAHSRFLSLRYATVGFSSCCTQQIFIVDRSNV